MKATTSLRRILITLLVLQTVLLLIVAWNTAPGWDEWGHLPSGLFTVQYGNYSPYCVNPPLTRVWCSIPVWLAGGGIAFEPLPTLPGFRSEGLLGLTYIEQQREKVFSWMSLARTAVIPIALFGTVLIWSIGNRLFTRSTATVASVLWVFSPTVITFGASITPDVTAAVFGLFAAWRFYIWLRLSTLRTAVWLGLATGLAMLSKATWLILPLVFVLVAASYACRYPNHWRWKKRVKQGALVAGICWLSIHAMYEFEETLVPLGRFNFVSFSLGGVKNDRPGVTPESGNRFRDTWLAHVPAPLPGAYMRGIDIQKHDFESKMTSYFFGQWRENGWWYYYIVGMWLKEPVAIWLMAALGLMFWVSKRFRFSSHTRVVSLVIVLAPGTLLLGFVSSQTGFNHHLRYVLPFLPCFYLLIAAGVEQFRGSGRLVTVALVGWYAVSSLSMVPRSYAYFTEAIGGPEQGWRYLGDSNLDWGQDILTAKKWMEANPKKRPVYFVYSLAMIDFRKLGIDAADGRFAVTPDGPMEAGWWVVFARPLLNTENRWFREHEPTEKLSITTSVYEITPENVRDRSKTQSLGVSQ